MIGIFAHLHDLADHYTENHTESGDALVGAEEHTAEDSSSVAVQIVEKKEKLKEARKQAHKAHKAQHFTKGMFWDSAVVKTKILLPVFAGSLALSAFFPEAFDALAVVFIGLGTRISYEAVSSCRHLLNKSRKAAAPRKPGQSPVQAFVDYRKKIDVKTSAEIAIGLISSIHTMLLEQQIIIMAMCGIAMTAGPPAMTNILLAVEGTGMRLAQQARDLKPTNRLTRFLVKKDWHNRLGDFLEDSTTRLFNVMPWLGVVAKGVTGGRVFAHGVAPLENLFGEYAESLLKKELLWGATGAAVGIGADIAYRSAARLITQRQRAAARAALFPLLLAQRPDERAQQHYASHFEKNPTSSARWTQPQKAGHLSPAQEGPDRPRRTPQPVAIYGRAD